MHWKNVVGCRAMKWMSRRTAFSSSSKHPMLSDSLGIATTASWKSWTSIEDHGLASRLLETGSFDSALGSSGPLRFGLKELASRSGGPATRPSRAIWDRLAGQLGDLKAVVGSSTTLRTFAGRGVRRKAPGTGTLGFERLAQ